jgi:group I intron endonuclease
MYIYKITNTINNRWYIGKTNGRDPNYMGSGKILKQAYAKYGQENFVKEVLEICSSEEELNLREQHWISTTNATSDPMSYNLAKGGAGGDLSKFIPYDKIDYSDYKMQGVRKWWDSLSILEKKEIFKKQAENRTKGWYVSRIDDLTETYVDNISKWCEENGVDKSMPSNLNNPNGRLFQKQTKGWRIRRSDMPPLPPYTNRRSEPTDNKCKGKGWKLVNGKRVWYDKYNE